MTFEQSARALWNLLFSEGGGRCNCTYPDRPDPKCLAAIADALRAAYEEGHQAGEKRQLTTTCPHGCALCRMREAGHFNT
jgi:hypothetical protein